MYFITSISTCVTSDWSFLIGIYAFAIQNSSPLLRGRKKKRDLYPFQNWIHGNSNLPQWIIRDRLLREPAASVISASPFEFVQWIDSWLKAKYPCEGEGRSWNFFPLTSPRTSTFISIMSLLLEPMVNFVSNEFGGKRYP